MYTMEDGVKKILECVQKITMPATRENLDNTARIIMISENILSAIEAEKQKETKKDDGKH